MTMSLSTLAPSPAPTSSARDAAPVSGPPSTLAAPPAPPAQVGPFALALQAAQGRDELAPAHVPTAMPQTADLPADAQSGADEARDALAAVLLTPIVSVPVSVSTAQILHIRGTDLDDPDSGVPSTPSPTMAPGALRHTTLGDMPPSGARLETAAASVHTDAVASKSVTRNDALAAITDSHTELASPASAAGNPIAWRHVLSTELDPSTSSTAALKLPASPPSQWREPLLNTLGERVQWHIQRGSEQAVIRLDPPNLGRIDIVIKQEGGFMQVHLSATHREVVQQLQGLSDGLRQELAARQSGDVAVLVSDPSRDGDGRQQRRQGSPDGQPGRPGRALSDADDTQPSLRTFSMQTEDR